jgi:uncharacterized SAM-binding protein YcdF (DUF218 family)
LIQETDSPPAIPVQPGRTLTLRQAVTGLILAVLTWLIIAEIVGGVLRILDSDWLILLAATAGALVGITRARSLLWTAAGLMVALFGIIGFTPLVSGLMPGVVREEPARPAPAIVVLASDNDRGLEMSAEAQARVLHGYELLGQGYAPRLALSRGAGRNTSWTEAVRRQMAQIGLHHPVEETRPVENTHDEAVEVARMARDRGWTHVILVTHPWHMRRAAAVFEKAGVKVVCSPCVERRYNHKRLSSVHSRLAAFRDWSHEVVGLWLYRRRGWI